MNICVVSVDFYPNPAEGSSGSKRGGLGPLPVDIGEGTPDGGSQSRNLPGTLHKKKCNKIINNNK